MSDLRATPGRHAAPSPPESDLSEATLAEGPTVEGPAVPPVATSRLRILAIFASVLTLVVAVGVTTHLAEQPQVRELQREVLDVNRQLTDVKSESQAAVVHSQMCESAAKASRASLTHWNHYMDTVQDLYLAASNEEATRVLARLADQYRLVVQDKIPTENKISGCIAS